MKSTHHLQLGFILAVLYLIVVRISPNQLIPTVLVILGISYLIDLDHLVVYMLTRSKVAVSQIFKLDVDGFWEGMSTLDNQYFIWHTAVILATFFLVGFLFPIQYRIPAYLALVAHWVTDFLLEVKVAGPEVGVRWV